MSVKFGYRRIILILSTMAAVAIGFSCFCTVYYSLTAKQDMYNRHCNDYDTIAEFWSVWDGDRLSSGKYEVIRNLLGMKSRLGSALVINSKKVSLHPQEIFPGVNKSMINMSMSALNEEAQVAKQQAIEEVTKKIETYEYWGTKSSKEIILVSAGAALAGIVLGYCGIWLILWLVGREGCKFIAWIAYGFNEGKSMNILNGQGGPEKEMARDVIKWSIIIVIAAIAFALAYKAII